MTKTKDLAAQFSELVIIHQKIPSHEVGRHSHDEHEFFLPIQGEIAIQYDGIRVAAGPGRMLYVPPKVDHSFTSASQGSGERIIVLVTDKFWRTHTKKKYSATSFPANSLAKELLFYLLIHPQAKGTKYFLEALVQNLSETVDGANTNLSVQAAEHLEGKVTDVRVKKALSEITASFGTLAFQSVAKKSGLSLRNFNRLFLKETGIGPKDYALSLG